MKILGVDIGLAGGISDGVNHLQMPTIKVELKAARYIQDLDSKGKKQYIKSGPNKGQLKMKLKTPAKYETKLDLHTIYKLFTDADIIVFESQGTSFGNSAKSTRTTSVNYGKLLAIAELSNSTIVIVPPHVWKKALGLSKDKLESIALAEKLSNAVFRTKRGALLDGPAEAYLIQHWYTITKDKHGRTKNSSNSTS